MVQWCSGRRAVGSSAEKESQVRQNWVKECPKEIDNSGSFSAEPAPAYLASGCLGLEQVERGKDPDTSVQLVNSIFTRCLR